MHWFWREKKFNLRNIFSNFKDIFEDIALDATLSQCLAFKAELRYASSHLYAFEMLSMRMKLDQESLFHPSLQNWFKRTSIWTIGTLIHPRYCRFSPNSHHNVPWVGFASKVFFITRADSRIGYGTCTWEKHRSNRVLVNWPLSYFSWSICASKSSSSSSSL